MLRDKDTHAISILWMTYSSLACRSVTECHMKVFFFFFVWNTFIPAHAFIVSIINTHILASLVGLVDVCVNNRLLRGGRRKERNNRCWQNSHGSKFQTLRIIDDMNNYVKIVHQSFKKILLWNWHFKTYHYI